MKSLNVRHITLALLPCAYAVLWVGGVVQNWRSVQGAKQSWLAVLFLTVAVIIVLIGVRSRGERVALLQVAALGFAVEVVGVHFGLPFGKYYYSDALGPRLLGVPPAIALAWTTLAAYVKQAVASLHLTPLAELLVAAGWLTAIDLLIDPLAANQLGYWHWDVKGFYYGIPATNFIGWFLVSLLVFWLLRKNFRRSRPVRLTGVSIVLFFTLLAVGFHLTSVVVTGFALLLLEGLTSSGQGRSHGPVS